jgi:hypothetical protein
MHTCCCWCPSKYLWRWLKRSREYNSHPRMITGSPKKRMITGWQRGLFVCCCCWKTFTNGLVRNFNSLFQTDVNCFFFYREMSNVLGGGVELEIYAYVAAQTGATVWFDLIRRLCIFGSFNGWSLFLLNKENVLLHVSFCWHFISVGTRTGPRGQRRTHSEWIPLQPQKHAAKP